jgi:hypothetical protein
VSGATVDDSHCFYLLCSLVLLRDAAWSVELWFEELLALPS